MEPVTRRRFLGLTAAGTGAVGVSALGFSTAEATQVKQRLRIEGAQVKRSVCPYCAVGCSLLAYTKTENGHTELLQIEGDPDSPVNEGTLCPKGATSLQLAISKRRVPSPMYRPPGATDWQTVSWDFTLDKLAQNIKASRDRTFITQDANGNVVNRCEGIAFAGGAAFSSEEGYLAAKLMRGLGVVHIEQQARV
ncbi:MAG TPA: twin-arginine translocation signal domain-containing protein [Actinophytocola sp.]|uniref:twin-arginine translocation signal domain-containing protein n=1 Tax=Actinophytocola sp. TaxID=1872138 RepID=UPI002DB61F51|nr:twin-arginine translocation signal domain-containing protein [Actinophytocola sp.]HEU5469143.1 twin-arginine translocation signal domain-containing protein [Actinophytocola sp.]